MSTQPKTVSIPNILPKITKPWSPKLIANLNGEYDLKIAKLRGSYVFHAHADTDELFYILSGTLIMRMKEPGQEESQEREDVVLQPGDVFVVPQGVRHCPVTKDGEEVVAILLERTGTLNSGDAGVIPGLTNEVEDFRQNS